MSVTHTLETREGIQTIENFTKAKAIRQKCMDCTCWQEAEVRKCPSPMCALFPFRFGNEKGLLPENTEHLYDSNVIDEDEEDDWANEVADEEQ